MRIGLFTHSGNARGGVVHALSVGDALAEAGHDVSLLAPLGPRGFFRPTRCRSVALPLASDGRPGSAERVGCQIARIVQFLAASEAPRFDVWHAGDPITANALGAMMRLGAIGGFSRTVHHLDSFADQRLAAWQEAGLRDATALCCVSQFYQARLAAEFGRSATLVGNGVDPKRFSPLPGSPEHEARARARWPAGAGPRLLSLGGVEQRKNTLGVLNGFALARQTLPGATLLIAGGASVLDHSAYGALFQAALAESGLGDAISICGVVPDAEMPALYRAADMLLSPSLAEGFGLAAIEAMASGTPAIVSARPPFTEHLALGDCLFVDPENPHSLAGAIIEATRPQLRERLRRHGPLVAAGFSWRAVADRHRPVFHAVQERQQLHA